MRVLVLGEVAADAARVASGLEERGLQAWDGPLRMAVPILAADILVLCLSRWSAAAAAAAAAAARQGYPVVVVHGPSSPEAVPSRKVGGAIGPQSPVLLDQGPGGH